MNPAPLTPHALVILGGKGDLAERKLLPAIARLQQRGSLAKGTVVVGTGRRADTDDPGYRAWAREALEKAGLTDQEVASWCDRCLYYHSLGDGNADAFHALSERLTQIDAEHGLGGNRTFYLALPPGAFPGTIRGLGAAGLNRSPGWTRLVIEKPFGRDLDSARSLNQTVHEHFNESQVYRIDHYLGKETVQNLLVFRFANPIFESIWNRDRVESVQITVAEDLGVEQRAGYYDQAGALRDMMQNHITQLLSLVAMEVPSGFTDDAIRHEKIKVLRSLSALTEEDAVFGQYSKGELQGRPVTGYLDESGVPSGSRTETFVATRVFVDSWRWQGVPFYLRTGKRLPRKVTQIDVSFRRPPICLFETAGACLISENVLRIVLQPNEGFDLTFDVKKPGDSFDLDTRTLHFEYQDAFGPLPDAYETLLLDVAQGDQTLFVHAAEAEASWSLYAPVLEQRAQLHPYQAGTWGPLAANQLLAQKGHRWHTT